MTAIAYDDFITTCAGVGKELLILTSVQETIVQVSGIRPHNLMLASVEWPVMMGSHVLQPISLQMD